jgi:dTDP-6-deoxy-L-talose 4-dehydrogenase (NAD+)
MHVLVTGADGYIGRHVVAGLVGRGARVTAVDRAFAGGEPPGPGTRRVAADIFDPSGELVDAADVPDAVVHLAWQAGFVHNAPVHMTALSNHFTFLTALAEAGVGRIAVLGTMHEVGYFEGAIDETTPTDPRSLYGVAKDALRRALEISFAGTDHLLQWLRCYYITGDEDRSQSIFAKVLDAARREESTFPFTDGTARYDFIDVHELGDQIATVVAQSEVTGTINCCSGVPVALGERVEQFIAENGLDIRLQYGVFPRRPYDSPGIWGDPTRVRAVVERDRELRGGVRGARSR